MFISCENFEKVNQVEDVTLNINKTLSIKETYQYLQEFDNVECNYEVVEDYINVSLVNAEIIYHSHDYFTLIRYANYDKFIYLGTLSDSKFVIPYYGNEDIIDVKLFAIIIHLTH